jgi:cysteine synthase A
VDGIQGIGDGFIAPIVDISKIDRIIEMRISEAGATAKRLAREEGLLGGVSAGADVFSAITLPEALNPTGRSSLSCPIVENVICPGGRRNELQVLGR